MQTAWLYRWRFIKRHLLVLLVAFGWLLFQSQLAVASHDCNLQVKGESIMIQHLDHMMADTAQERGAMATPLCDKHCLPDVAQKDNGHSPLVALPVALSIAVIQPLCAQVPTTHRLLPPPAVGPPATIQFCRYRE